MTKILHYLNQFFAGIGGEDKAGQEFLFLPKAVGPGLRRIYSLPARPFMREDTDWPAPKRPATCESAGTYRR